MGGGRALKGLLSSLAAIAGFLMTMVGFILVLVFFIEISKTPPSPGAFFGLLLGIGIILIPGIFLFAGGNLLFIMAAAAGGRVFKVLALPVIIVDLVVTGAFGYLALLAIIDALTEPGSILGKILGVAFTLSLTIGMAAIPIYMAKRMLGK